MTTTIEVRQVPSRPALVVHARCSLSAIAPTLGKSFADVQRWAAAHGVSLQGPAIARYVVLSDAACELDAGFVGSTATTTDGVVGALDLGGCAAVCATHIGSYESLSETYAAIERWMGDNGYVPAGPMWEEYFSPPGTPAAQTRTDVYWPVRRR